MNKLTFLIARRYLLGARSEKNISIMVIICFLGIFIGAFALALVASIMNGFEKATHQKLRNIHAQIIMRSRGNELNTDSIMQVLHTEFPEVIAASPSTYKQIILQKTNSHEITNAIVFKAIEPEQEMQTSNIGQKIIKAIAPNKALPELVTKNQIVIGKKLAEELGITVGMPVELLYIPEGTIKGNKITLHKQAATISGIFSTGIEEFDSNLVLGSFSLLHRMFEHAGPTQLNLQLTPQSNEQEVIQRLKERLGLDTFSWKELYPALVSALKLEKYAMFFILALITLVASMNIISLIFMQIIRKRPDIAIFQAMGMRSNQIIPLFMLMGISLATIAGLAGLIAAWATGLLLEKYPFITLPDTYYVTHLPIHMEWYIFVLVLVLIIAMSTIASWIPAHKVKSIEVAQVLRFEG